MSEDDSEKQHKPSAKKLERLRSEGSFLRAREFYSGTTLIATLVVIYLCKTTFKQVWANNFYITYAHINAANVIDFSLSQLFEQLFFNNFGILLLLFLIILLIFLVSVTLFGKLHMPKKIITFKGERLSVLKNLKRIYSMQTLIELFKSSFKLILFVSLLLFFFHAHQLEIMNLQKVHQSSSLALSMSLFESFLFQLIAALALIAGIDALINYYQYNKKAMMTSQEVKEENKEMEGSPELKKKIRQAQQTIAMQRMQKEMPGATVVITNPTHYAIALRYTDKVDSAPVIIAKGVDHKALQIRQLAIKYAIPIYPAPELARAIYKTGTVGGMIHPELYMAVAIVLSYILQLQEYQMGRIKQPAPLTDLKIPEHFK